MVSKDFIKFGKENNLKHDKGIVYGVHNGYNITLSDGFGTKSIAVFSYFDENAIQKLNQLFDDKEILKKYRINNCKVNTYYIMVTLKDYKSFMNDFPMFIEWLFLRIDECNVTKDNICPVCKKPIDKKDYYLIFNNMAISVHEECYDVCKEDILNTLPVDKNKKCNYLNGFLGAVKGSIIGGFFYSFIIGSYGILGVIFATFVSFFADGYYKKSNGKVGRFKYPIIICVSIIGLFASVIISLFWFYLVEATNTHNNFHYNDIFPYIINSIINRQDGFNLYFWRCFIYSIISSLIGLALFKILKKKKVKLH